MGRHSIGLILSSAGVLLTAGLSVLFPWGFETGAPAAWAPTRVLEPNSEATRQPRVSSQRSRPNTGIFGSIELDAGELPRSAMICWDHVEESIAPRAAAPECEVLHSGEFSLDLAPGRYDLIGTAPAHVSEAVFGIHVSEGQRFGPVELMLQRGRSSVLGRVEDAEERPVQGALVRMATERNAHAGIVYTDQDGMFQVSVERPDVGAVSVDAPGYGREVRRVLVPGSVGVVRLAREAKLGGRVIWEHDGRVAVGAEVIARSRHQTDSSRVVTSSDGTFEFRGMSSGEYWVLASARGGQSSPLSVKVWPGEASVPLSIELQQAHSVEGVVVNSRRERCVGARVSLFGPSGAFVSQTKDEGISFNAVPTGDYGVRIECPGHPITVEENGFRVSEGAKLSGLVWEVEDGLSICGQVAGSVGSEGGTIVSASGPFGDYRTLQTDAQGKFCFTGVSSGEYELSTLSSDRRYPLGIPTKVVVRAEPVVGLNLVLPRLGRVTLSLQGSYGESIEQIASFLRGARRERLVPLVPNDEGKFESERVPFGSYELVVSDGRDLFTKGPVNLDSDQIEIAFLFPGRNGAIRGVVIDETGTRVGDARVIVRSTELRDFQPLSGEVTGAEVLTSRAGEFEVTNLADGPYLVRAQRGPAVGVSEEAQSGDDIVIRLREVVSDEDHLGQTADSSSDVHSH